MGRGDLSLSGVPLGRPTDNKIFILFNLQTVLGSLRPRRITYEAGVAASAIAASVRVPSNKIR